MKLQKKDLEKIILESGRDSLVNRELFYEGKLYNQFKIGNYGVADFIAFRRPRYNELLKTIDGGREKGTIKIIVLKNEMISISAFLQGIRLIRGVQRYLEIRNKEQYYDLSLTIIGSQIDRNSDIMFLPSIITAHNDIPTIGYNVDIDLLFLTYDFRVDGIWFHHEYGYALKNEGFE
jgi:hypothetical protein